MTGVREVIITILRVKFEQQNHNLNSHTLLYIRFSLADVKFHFSSFCFSKKFQIKFFFFLNLENWDYFKILTRKRFFDSFWVFRFTPTHARLATHSTFTWTGGSEFRPQATLRIITTLLTVVTILYKLVQNYYILKIKKSICCKMINLVYLFWLKSFEALVSNSNKSLYWKAYKKPTFNSFCVLNHNEF